MSFSLSTEKFTNRIMHTTTASSSSSIRVRRDRIFVAACIEQKSNTVIRRSANYQPPIWKYDYIQSLKSPFKGEAYNGLARELKDGVRIMLHKSSDPLLQLELIDALQRLGLTYHFDGKIKSILKNMHYDYNHFDSEDLYSTALIFRLLRQHGFNVSADVFNIFKDENRSFETSLCNDVKGMLQLYEASYLLVEGENIMEDARHFATKHLKEYVKKEDRNLYLSLLVSHALELPLHWRITRSEARWFINTYEIKEDMNPDLLALAKLDFNIVQAIHQDDLRYSSKWWRSTGLVEKLNFARDRLVENFLWTTGVFFEPEFGNFRRSLAKVNLLITTIDDVYDVYGTLDELELFTNAVKRWDINEVEELPDYMRTCFLTLLDAINEIAFQVLKERGVCVISYLKNSWAELCECYLLEAKWYHNNHMPTLEEYLENAYISISSPLIITHFYVWTNDQISTNGSFRTLAEHYPDIIYHASMILRLVDDLATSPDEIKRGDVPKSIQCYMHETGATEEEARAYMRKLIDEGWKKLNEACINANYENSPFSDVFKRTTMNLIRMAMLMYLNGDGHASQSQESIDRVLSLLVQPVP
ncbi:terpene synthase 10-like [Rutidosis leptorrhynchoides]|uniref:terpene synthase 10-like n=1 Tax=Rutidosis leptorrhynchoides TaxID=125765 RepID=UPI003A994AE2